MPLKTLLFFVIPIYYLSAQDLYVADNSYLYAKDVAVFVNNDIQLDTPTSTLYFRGDAQLVQNNDIKNSDAGELSIYQSQNTGIYEYNYWCSPVGTSAESTQGNTDFSAANNIHDPQDDVNSIDYGFTSSYNATATQLSNYWIYTLKDGEGYWSWKQVFDTGNIGTGYGFTLKGSPTSNNVLDFRGRPNNGTITVSCSYDGSDGQPTSGVPNYAETLTGNPYPSALDLKLFLAHPTNKANLSGEIFFWEQAVQNSHYLTDYEGGYGIYVPGNLDSLNQNGSYAVAPFKNYNNDGSDSGTTGNSGVDYSTNNARRFAAVGQGFIITSNVNGGIAVFENDMRVYFPEDPTNTNGAVFAKGTNSKQANESIKVPESHNGIDYKAIMENPTIVPEIRLHTHINNTYYKENVIAFREGTPNNNTYNKFFDARNINSLATDAYLISNGQELSIKSIKYDASFRQPLGIRASNDNTLFSVTIHKLNQVPDDVEVFIFDNETNSYTDIKNGTFEITLDKGTYTDRFEITFTAQTLGTDDAYVSENLKTFYNKNTSEIVIKNPDKLSIKTFKLFDISGKQVLNLSPGSVKTEYAFSSKSLSAGTYISSIETQNHGTLNKKMIIDNI